MPSTEIIRTIINYEKLMCIMEALTQTKRMVLTKEQIEEVQKFKQDLGNGSADIAFKGSLLEGKAYLNGLADIVEATHHS